VLARLLSRIAVSKPKAADAGTAPAMLPAGTPAVPATLAAHTEARPADATPVDVRPERVPPERIAVLNWIRWDVLPPFDEALLYAHPRRAQAAELLAQSLGIERAEALVRGLLEELGGQPVDRLLMVEILLRGVREQPRAIVELLRDAREYAPPLRARAAVINGQLAFEEGEFALARRWADFALADVPDAWAAQVLHGLVLEAEGRWEESLSQYRKLIATRPATPGLRNCVATMLLRQGRIADSLAQLVEVDHMALQPHAATQAGLWDGRLAEGDFLLITSGAAGAGIGDVIQHLRYLPGLRARHPDARLVLRTHPELLGLVRRMGMVDEVNSDAKAEDERFCAQTTLAQVALFHHLESEPAPLPAPFLDCAPERVAVMGAQVQARLGDAQASALRVGLRWRGRPGGIDILRSVPPAQLAPLFDLPGVAWISMLEHGNPELAVLKAGGLPVLDMSEALRDLTDTAALLCNLDLLITVDTSVAHLAGALGVPTWVLSRPDADGRWGMDARTALYRSVRLFRHPGRRDWDAVVVQVRQRLAACLRMRAAGDTRAFASLLLEARLD
jgi:tetratricopeptide (TPR) repeat protein